MLTHMPYTYVNTHSFMHCWRKKYTCTQESCSLYMGNAGCKIMQPEIGAGGWNVSLLKKKKKWKIHIVYSRGLSMTGICTWSSSILLPSVGQPLLAPNLKLLSPGSLLLPYSCGIPVCPTARGHLTLIPSNCCQCWRRSWYRVSEEQELFCHAWKFYI